MCPLEFFWLPSDSKFSDNFDSLMRALAPLISFSPFRSLHSILDLWLRSRESSVPVSSQVRKLVSRPSELVGLPLGSLCPFSGREPWLSCGKSHWNGSGRRIDRFSLGRVAMLITGAAARFCISQKLRWRKTNLNIAKDDPSLVFGEGGKGKCKDCL